MGEPFLPLTESDSALHRLSKISRKSLHPPTLLPLSRPRKKRRVDCCVLGCKVGVESICIGPTNTHTHTRSIHVDSKELGQRRPQRWDDSKWTATLAGSCSDAIVLASPAEEDDVLARRERSRSIHYPEYLKDEDESSFVTSTDRVREVEREREHQEFVFKLLKISERFSLSAPTSSLSFSLSFFCSSPRVARIGVSASYREARACT